jgi:hypothetical protein
MNRGTTGAIAVALWVMLLVAPGAEARVFDDPCPRGDVSSTNRPDGTILMCDKVAPLEPEEAVRLNKFPQRRCTNGYKLAGTDASYKLGLTAHWDYWAKDGWVSWTGGGAFIIYGDYAEGYMPLVRNWWIGQQNFVRYFQSCDRRTQTRGLPFTPPDEGEVAAGDAEPDDLGGTPGPDVYAGKGGDDDLAGAGGDDEQYAGAGDDEAAGGPGDDQILSGLGDDAARGGSGSDSLFDDQGHDDMRGGLGGDRFSAHDPTRDRIDCGPGEDVVVADSRDRIAADCEHVYTSRKDAPKRPPP